MDLRGKKMEVANSKLPYLLIVLFAVLLFIISLWSIIYEEQWFINILALYGISIIITAVLLFLSVKKKPSDVIHAVKEFEKTLEGKLHHFKCPICKGIFAIKKSKRDNKKSFILTCPDCGNVGKISDTPKSVVEKIPKRKSSKKSFKCANCGEFISIWAEGTEIFHKMKINSCPYCGEKQSMTII